MRYRLKPPTTYEAQTKKGGAKTPFSFAVVSSETRLGLRPERKRSPVVMAPSPSKSAWQSPVPSSFKSCVHS